ncbi:MAG TPA: serine/threonine-protein kinase [Burkholderiaceae bacterium]
MLPERIGRYDITAEIGRGSTSIVYRGIDPRDGRAVAIKTLQRSADSDGDADEILRRFRDEALAVRRLDHPGLVAIDEIGEDGLNTWLAMPHVEGRTLADMLRGTPPLAEERALAILDELLDALGAAHREGLTHRDVKPANVLLTPAGRVKLVDFGVARLRDLGLTRVSSIIGTPAFMAPEQFTGRALDHRADLFACGALLHQLLAGRPPFCGAPAAVMQQILHEEPPPTSRASGGRADPAYDSVVARALAKRAEDRFASADEMRDALHAAASHAADAPLATVVGTVVGTLVQDAGSLLGHLSPEQRAAFEHARAHRLDPMAGVVLRDAPVLAQRVDAFALYVPDAGSCHAIVDIPHREGADETSAAVPAASAATLPPEACATAQQLLARRVGPVASVMVRRAADTAGGSLDVFVANLLAGTSASQQAALRAELEAALAPPQRSGR